MNWWRSLSWSDASALVLGLSIAGVCLGAMVAKAITLVVGRYSRRRYTRFQARPSRFTAGKGVDCK